MQNYGKQLKENYQLVNERIWEKNQKEEIPIPKFLSQKAYLNMKRRKKMFRFLLIGGLIVIVLLYFR